MGREGIFKRKIEVGDNATEGVGRGPWRMFGWFSDGRSIATDTC